MTDLGRLERVGAMRDVWPDEARDFTPWLASETNITLLSETLGLGPDGLEVEGVEEFVGPFRADILCRDTNSAEGDRVLIENMYGRSDHDHLGKLLTYGAGLRARTVVLIAEDIRPEHRAALDWLNTLSDDDHRFFAVTVDLWRIGDSLTAPRFNVVVAPNDWTRAVRSPATRSQSEFGDLYVRYWTGLAEVIASRETAIRPRKALSQYWTTFGLGRTHFQLAANASARDSFLTAAFEAFGAGPRVGFRQLHSERAAIEAELGFLLEWDEVEGRKVAKASVRRPADVRDIEDWPSQHAWLADKLTALYRVLAPRVRHLDLTDTDDFS